MESYQVTLPLSLVIMLVTTLVVVVMAICPQAKKPDWYFRVMFLVMLFCSIVAALSLLWEVVTTNKFLPGVPVLALCIASLIASYKDEQRSNRLPIC